MAELPSLDLACARLFDEAPCWISIQDRDYRIIDANRELIESFGDRKSENCYTVYKGRTEPCPECPVVRTFEDGREHTSQQIIFDQRGLPHDVLVNTRPLRDRAGEIVAVMQLFTDFSDEKELEGRLHESVLRFHNLFDNAPCFISVQDRCFRILQSNHRIHESFGEALGKCCYEVYKKRADPCPHCPVAETFQDGNIHTSEEVLVDNRGRQVHVLVYTAPLRDREGSITSVMEMSTDVTEIRTLQNRLAVLGQLVGGVAHSIKNILEGLRGGIYIVNLGFRDHNEQDVRAGCEMLERNVGRLSTLILDLLCCARDRSPRKLPVALPSVLQEVLRLFAPRAAEFGIRLASEIGAEVEVFGEPKDIHALVSNLVTNAIDACNADQNEKPHRVTVRLRREGADAIIEVEDDGAGMDTETQQALFHGLVSTKGPGGTGLGLLVSHKIATEHGGRIALCSAPGKGSVFTVRLPIGQQEVRNDERTGERKENPGGR